MIPNFLSCCCWYPNAQITKTAAQTSEILYLGKIAIRKRTLVSSSMGTSTSIALPRTSIGYLRVWVPTHARQEIHIFIVLLVDSRVTFFISQYSTSNCCNFCYLCNFSFRSLPRSRSQTTKTTATKTMATMTTATASASTVVRPTTQATAARSHLRASSAVDLLPLHQRNNNRRRRIRHRPLLFLLLLLAVHHHTPPFPFHIRDEDHRSRAVVAVDALSIAPRIVRRGGLPTMGASSSSSLCQSPSSSSSSSSSSMMATSDGSQLGGYVATTSSNCAEEGARRSDDDDVTRRMTNKTWIIQWR